MPQKPSIGPLSIQWATLDMLCFICCFFSLVLNCLLVYWNPRSELSRIRDNSDQGWQYQHANYVQELKDHGVIRSMSRKGNSMDNGLMENFFGLLKTEMFYDWEDQYQTLDDLEAAIENYIYYYNHDRIKERLKGLTPLEWREMRSQVQSWYLTVPVIYGREFWIIEEFLD